MGKAAPLGATSLARPAVSDLAEIACDLAAGCLNTKNVIGFLESDEPEIAPE